MSRFALVEPKVHALTTRFCPPIAPKMFKSDVDFGFRHADQVESTADAKHGEPLLGHRLQSHKVKDVIGTSGRRSRTASTGLLFVESMTSVAPNRRAASSRFCLDVDDNDPRSAGYARATNGIEPDPPAPKITTVSPALTFAVFKTEPAPVTTPQPSKRSLGEGNLLWNDSELVLVDERPFGKTAQPETLEQANPLRLKRGASAAGAVSTPDVGTGRAARDIERTLRTTARENLRRDLRHGNARHQDRLRPRSPRPRDQAPPASERYREWRTAGRYDTALTLARRQELRARSARRCPRLRNQTRDRVLSC
jgi:hypothetical protein